MVYVLLILGFIRGRLAKRIELADSGKKVEVMPYVRNIPKEKMMLLLK